MNQWLKAPDLNSGVSDQQSVGSSPSHNTCFLKDPGHYWYKLSKTSLLTWCISTYA